MTEEPLFHEALAKPATERAAFLDAACAGQPELRAAIESLLAAHEDSAALLDRPAALDQAVAPDPAPPPSDATGPGDEARPPQTTVNYEPGIVPGAVIAGRYTLQERIGEGGMGEVWVAKQTEPVKRKVALKLIKAGMDTKAVLQRFDAERQALALMDHPNIARVLDGGMTSDRRPFFVMELVNGLPLTRFCDEAKLGIRERLELFAGICQAVQHAHQKGIIHRDLKPSNILVTLLDARPVPKVIDFGVAKAVGGKLLDESLSTQFGAVVGTLEYMAPEQAGYSGSDIDTRADIYSLGVILYELLTGLRPIDSKRLRKAALIEIVRIIQEEEPSKPSTRLSTDEALPSLAALRQVEPRRLMAILRGELDWVVMKCLEKQRDRRYETANGLARDIQRYLADEVVEARPPSAGYRLRKFARKNQAALASATAIAVLLVMGLSASLWQMQRAIAAEAQANTNLKAEQQAREDETKARQQAFVALRSMTADVVERKFAQGTVLTEDDRAFFRGVIAQYDAFAAIRGDDADSRAVRAEGRFRVGSMRSQLGELKEAEQDYDQALSLYKQLVADSPSRADFCQALAECHNGRGALVFYDKGRPKEAEQDFEQAMSIQKQLVADFPAKPGYRQELAGTHSNRGNLLRDTGRPKDAEKDFEQALSIQKQLAADFPDRPEFRQYLAKHHNNRGTLLRDVGRLKDAEKDFEQALSIQKQLVADFPSQPEFRVDLASYHNNRGLVLSEGGRPEDAEKDFDQALSIQKQLAADFPAKPEYRQYLFRSHYNRGILLRDTGRPKEAEQDFEQALSIQKQLVADFPAKPEYRQELAGTHGNRGRLLRDTGRPKDAEKDFEQALSIQKQLAADFPAKPGYRQDLFRSHYHRGILLRDTGRPKEAEKDFEQALSIQKQLAADFPDRPEFRTDLASIHNNRGILLHDTGRLKEAEQDYEQALSIQRQLVAEFPNRPDRRNDLAGTCVNLAALHQEQGNWSAAKALLREGWPHHLAALKASPRNPIYRQFYRNYLGVLSGVHAGLLEQHEAVRSAETCRDLGWNAAADAFTAACGLSLCVAAVAKHDKLNEKQRKEAVQFYGDAAMKMICHAVSKGYNDVRELKNLDSLRQREDFKKLIAELEGKTK
jgi:serine/threonine protein kinase/lipoprotein NlpI